MSRATMLHRHQMLDRRQTVLTLAAAIALACLGSHPADAQAPAQPAKPPAARPPAPAPQRTRRAHFGDGGPYTASPGGKKVCFALPKPANSKTTPPNRPRDPT